MSGAIVRVTTRARKVKNHNLSLIFFLIFFFIHINTSRARHAEQCQDELSPDLAPPVEVQKREIIIIDISFFMPVQRNILDFLNFDKYIPCARLSIFVESVASHIIFVPEVDYSPIHMKRAENSVNLLLLDTCLFSRARALTQPHPS